jgi:hypothetical protein
MENLTNKRRNEVKIKKTNKKKDMKDKSQIKGRKKIIIKIDLQN